MVNLEQLEPVPVAEFGYAWRITDPRWAFLADEVLAQLHPVSEAQCKAIIEPKVMRMRDPGPYTLKAAEYHAESNVSLVEKAADDTARIRSWFEGLPINKDEMVYVCWFNVSPTAALVTSWGTFSSLWDSLWYPFDVMSVFDDSMNWAVLLGPEEAAAYAERGAVPPSAGPDDERWAYELVRNPPH